MECVSECLCFGSVALGTIYINSNPNTSRFLPRILQVSVPLKFHILLQCKNNAIEYIQIVSNETGGGGGIDRFIFFKLYLEKLYVWRTYVVV